MRLIDADALKKSIDECDICNVCPERKVRCNYDCEFPDHLSPKFEALIDAQPTIEPKREWIPCSERLPNDGDRIVVQYANGDLGVINSCRIRLWNIINSPYATAVAWMPSPEPWKGADDD